MARIRSIKPEFFTSDDICALSPLARLLYVGLLCEVDREGRLVWSPGVPPDRDGADQWRARLWRYRPGRFWMEGDWGPRPESGKSRVPAALLAEWQERQASETKSAEHNAGEDRSGENRAAA